MLPFTDPELPSAVVVRVPELPIHGCEVPMDRPTEPTGTLNALKFKVSATPKLEGTMLILTDESVLGFPKTLSFTKRQVIHSVLC